MLNSYEEIRLNMNVVISFNSIQLSSLNLDLIV
jgi:hypothetical protein